MNSLKNRWSRRLDNTKLNIREDFLWRGDSFGFDSWELGSMFIDRVVNSRFLISPVVGRGAGHLQKAMERIRDEYWWHGYSPFHEKYCYKGDKNNDY